MTCLTPYFKLPEIFTNWEVETDQAEGLTLNIRNETLVFYVGFNFDGVKQYKDLRNSVELKKFANVEYFTKQPHFDTPANKVFVPLSNKPISYEAGDVTLFTIFDYVLS